MPGTKTKHSGSKSGTAAPKKATAGASLRTAKAPVPLKTLKERGPRSNAVTWDLRLYVAGQSPKSLTAFSNLKQLCEDHLKGKYRIEVVDLIENPQLAKGDQILAIPTLVRKLPQPLKKIIGDLSNTERTLVGLDLLPRSG